MYICIYGSLTISDMSRSPSQYQQQLTVHRINPHPHRSGASGYLLPLSGGADSSSTAALVASMCQMVVGEAKRGNKQARNCVEISSYFFLL